LEAASRIREAGVVGRFQAEHRVDLSFDRVGDLRDRDLGGIPGDPAPSTRPAEALDQPGLRECSQLLLQEPQRDLLPLGDLTSGDQSIVVLPLGELDHGAHRVLELL
jgi:hypothetical protein